jgi:GNAT superfamily N-acetyltransferase
MLGRVTSATLLQTLESYYDAAPRPWATTEEVGPFTLFVKIDPTGWDFYARPRLGLEVRFTAGDVQKVRDRQRQLALTENLEWVHETTPTLLDAARADGLPVQECPILVLPRDPSHRDPSPPGPPVSGPGDVTSRIAVLAAGSPDLAAVDAAIAAGFAGTDDFEPQDPGRRGDEIRSGLLVLVAAYDERGAVIGGGSHSPRGTATELTGISVLPRARRRGVGAAITRALVEEARRRRVETIFLSAQDDAVARVYERVGFTRVGTACIGEVHHGSAGDAPPRISPS